MKFKTKLTFVVSLQMQIEAPSGADAYKLAKDYESQILAKEWFYKDAPEGVRLVAEELYMSKVDFAAGQELKLG